MIFVFRSLILALFCLPLSAQVVDINSNLVLCLPMNGNGNDYSGYTNNGIVSGATPTVNRFGVANAAMHFDGSNDVLSVPSSTSIALVENDDELTITGWCKNYSWSPVLDVAVILEKYNATNDWGWSFSLCNPATVGTGNDAFFINNYPFIQSASISAVMGTWEFYAVTYSKLGQITKFYKNGTLIQTVSNGGATLDNTGSGMLFIGYSPVGTDEYAHADYDEIRLYNRALTSQEISAVYNLPYECDVATFSVSSLQACSGQTLQFTDLSINTPTAWVWQFPGGSPSTSSLSSTVVTWSLSGIYTVSLTTTDGSGVSNTAIETIIVNGTPQISAGSFSVCNNSAITLTASGAATYSWSGPGNASATTNSLNIPNAAVSSAGIYTVTGVSAIGSCSSVGYASLAILAATQITVTNNSPLCPGATLQLSVTSGAATYQWTGPQGFSSNLQNPSITNFSQANNAGSYSVTATNSNNCQSFAAVTTSALITPTIAAIGATVCPGEQFVLTTTCNAISFLWTGPSAFFNTLQNPTLTVATPGFGNYTVVAAAANSCTVSAMATVFVKPVPPIAAFGTTVCYGAGATLYASGASSYQWTGPNSFNSSLQNPVFPSVLNVQPQSYTVVGTANNCTASAVAIVATIPNPLLTAASLSVCSNSPTTFTVSGASTYTWSGPFISNATGSVLTIPSTNAANAGVYSVNGQNTLTSCVSTLTVSLDALPLPLVSAAGGSVCFGGTATLTAFGLPGYTYSWTGPNAYSAIGPTVLVSPAFPNGNIYNVTAVAPNSCSNSANALVQVFSLPNLSVTSTSMICLGASATMTIIGASSYQVDSGPIATNTLLVVTPMVTTTYTIRGYSNNQCEADLLVSVTVDRCLGLSEWQEKETSFTIFPNPSDAQVTIRTSSASEIQIINALGQMIKTSRVDESTEYQMSVEGLAKGIYYVRSVETGEVVKLVVGTH